jgi:hypothetical protein
MTLLGFTKTLSRLSIVIVAGFGATALAQLNLPGGSYTPTVTFSTNNSLPAFATTVFSTLPSGYSVNVVAGETGGGTTGEGCPPLAIVLITPIAIAVNIEARNR